MTLGRGGRGSSGSGLWEQRVVRLSQDAAEEAVTLCSGLCLWVRA
jgi:hypothetical protein